MKKSQMLLEDINFLQGCPIVSDKVTCMDFVLTVKIGAEKILT